MHGFGADDWPGTWLMLGMLWLILIGGSAFLVTRALPPKAGQPHPEPAEGPLDILDQRFARGEVDLDTYRTQRAALIAAPTPAARP